MAEKRYENSRPAILAELRRSVEVEAGHCCSIKGCQEHTYLEIHHIDGNRENNIIENLILLCDKHHKMAHAKIIDRKALREYKKLLADSHVARINERLDQLEKLLKENKSDLPVLELAERQPVNNKVKKFTPKRHEILDFALTHVAISHYEKVNNIYFEHHVEFVFGKNRLLLDAVRQDDDLEEDIIIDVYYLRKAYLDAPVYGTWLEKKIELYELITGRKAKGILLIVVGRERMKGEGYLMQTEYGVSSCEKNITLEVFSCVDVGFHPGAVSAAMFASNLKETNAKSEEI